MPKKRVEEKPPMALEEEFRLSVKNRLNFLKQKKREWSECESEREKKDIIVELIQLEPTHLAEDWILNQVINWMKDRQNNLDYLNAAFITKGKRDEITEKQRDDLAKAWFSYHKIEKIAEKKVHKIDAIRTVVMASKDDNFLPQDAAFDLKIWLEKQRKKEMAVKQKLKRYKKVLDARSLPYPYYGKDIAIVDYGNENYRIELFISNKPIVANGVAIFGDTKMSFPVKKKTK